MTEIKIGKRTIPLYYSTYEMIAIQRDIGCTAFELREKVFGFHLKDEDDPTSLEMDVAKDPEKTEKFGKLLAILGNAGLEEAGEKPDLTDKWIMRHIKPAMIVPYAVTALAEIIEGNQMESQKAEQENAEVDEGLEEEIAKKQPGN